MIDALMLLGDNHFAASLAAADAIGAIDDGRIHGIVAAPARGSDYALPAANDRLAVAVGHRPDVRRLVRVDPRQGAAAAAELRRGITELGCAGLFLHPDEEVFRIQEAQDLVAAAAELGVPTVIVAGIPLRSEPLQVLDLAEAVPHADLVLTSGGQINISGLSMVDAWFALRRSPRIRILSNGEYRQDFLEDVVAELGAERLLFASFAPVFDLGFEIGRIRNIGWDDISRQAIEVGNAAALFGFAPNG